MPMQALIRKKVRAIDKDALVQIKIPNPLPLSWGRTVQPYTPQAATASSLSEDHRYTEATPCSRAIEEENLLATDWSKLRKDFLVTKHIHPQPL